MQLSAKQTDNLGGLSFRFFNHVHSNKNFKDFKVYSPINSVEVFAYRTASLVLGPCFFTGMTIFFLGASILLTLISPFTLTSYLLERKARIKSGGSEPSKKEKEAMGYLFGIPLTLVFGIYSAINIGLSLVVNAIDLIICTALAIGGKIKGAIKNHEKTASDSLVREGACNIKI